MDPLPSLNKVYSLIVQEESHNGVPHSSIFYDEANVLVNVVESRKPFGRGKNPSVTRILQDIAPFAIEQITLLNFVTKSMVIPVPISKVIC